MGRKFQVGTLDEILTINQEVEGTQLVVDWGHLHALHLGTLKKVEDFRAIAEKIEANTRHRNPPKHALPLLKNRIQQAKAKNATTPSTKNDTDQNSACSPK